MRTTTLLMACLLPVALSAGVPNKRPGLAKLDAQLKLWVNNPDLLREGRLLELEEKKLSGTVLSVIFKADAGNVRQLVERHGGRLHASMGQIHTAEFRLDSIEAFAAEPEVVKIESPQEVRLHNDHARQTTGAEQVNTAQLPEGIPYTGKGVIIGVVDTGLDFLHPDFRLRTDTTKTRVLAIWDQVMADAPPPAGFLYGSEWSGAQVQAEISSAAGVITEKDSAAHGTHVMGSAGGLRGMAYDADLIAVKTKLVGNGDYTFSNTPKTLDACNYIYKQAEARNRPAVVNFSLGFVFGAPHDGTSLYEQGLGYMVTQRPGFIICASAGNEGTALSHHGGYQIDDDSVWTYVNSLNGATWYAVTDKQYDGSLEFSVSVDTLRANFRTGGRGIQAKAFTTEWFTVRNVKDSINGIHYTVVLGNGDTLGTIRMTAADYDSKRSEFYIYPRDKAELKVDSNSLVNLYKINVRGTGMYHSWTQALNGFGYNVQSFGARTDASFRNNDNKYGIGIPATGNNIISVGAHLNKVSYKDIKGREQRGLNSANLKEGTLAPFSSNGPTLDNRMKPDFTAPGLNIASSLSRHAAKDSVTMVDQYTAVFSGTSMSCPITVGAVALYLEKSPMATYDQVRSAILDNIRTDANTSSRGPLPNNIWGHGKLDIFKAMGGVTTDVAAEDDALMTNRAYPNPAVREVTIVLPTRDKGLLVHIYDAAGRLVHTQNTAASGTLCTVDVSGWSSGAYVYRLHDGARIATSGTFLVQ